ncbi:hypothetical protein Tco_1411913 [Tanacetum coccineum]
MGVIMELYGGMCVWLRVMAVEEEDEEGINKEDEEAGGDTCRREVGGFADLYRNMSHGDWQSHQAHWMGQQDERWGRIDTWMEKQNQKSRLNVIFDEKKLGSS